MGEGGQGEMALTPFQWTSDLFFKWESHFYSYCGSIISNFIHFMQIPSIIIANEKETQFFFIQNNKVQFCIFFSIFNSYAWFSMIKLLKLFLHSCLKLCVI